MVGVAVLVLVAAAATAVVIVVRGDGGGESGAAGASSTTSVPIEERDLVQSEELDGELSFGDTAPATAGRDGVVTEATPVGETVGQGEVLFHLDLQPTVLLHGAIPAFRDLSVDADPGDDVTQLEQALVDLGFGAGITVDAEFTDVTAAAVTDWEESLGRSDPDGVVTLGDVVFAPRDLRIAQLTAEPGTQVQAGGEVVQVTNTAKVVMLQLTQSEAATLEAGTPVTATLPDGTEAAGTIEDVATEPSSGESSSSSEDEGTGESSEQDSESYPVTIALDDPAAADAFDSGTVKVVVERSRIEDATAAPITALVAQTEGGYALQLVDASEPEGYRLVPVEVGAIAGEWAEVSGDGIAAGVEVVMPQ
jgi:hypothetical protein